MKLKLEDPTLFTKVIELISDLVLEARIKINEFGLSIIAIDPANVSMVSLKVPKSAFYPDGTYFYSGISRAWISIDIYKGSPVYTVFNGYGLTTFQIASLVSNFLGMSSQRLSICNNGEHEGDFYINNFGMAIGDDSIIKNLVTYDVNLSGSGSFSEVSRTVIGNKAWSVTSGDLDGDTDIDSSDLIILRSSVK